MHRTKHSIARTGACIARAEHLIPANDPTPTEQELVQADLDRDFNKGPKLARRHDAVAFDRQTGADQLRVVLGFEQREIDQRDARNLAAAWTGLDRSDLDLPKEQ